MIKRIVKLTIRLEEVESFREIFQTSKETILSMPGCHHVECLQSVDDPRLFFTYSHWDSVADLNNYRHTDKFADIWKRTKALFDDRPEAWSTEEVDGD